MTIFYACINLLECMTWVTYVTEYCNLIGTQDSFPVGFVPSFFFTCRPGYEAIQPSKTKTSSWERTLRHLASSPGSPQISVAYLSLAYYKQRKTGMRARRRYLESTCKLYLPLPQVPPPPPPSFSLLILQATKNLGGGGGGGEPGDEARRGHLESTCLYLQKLETGMGFLVGDCLVAAAFLSYAGPFLSNYRDELVQEIWLKQVRRYMHQWL